MKISIFVFFFSFVAIADVQFVRWTGKEDPNGTLSHVLQVVNSKTKLSLKESDFLKLEAKPLARTYHELYVQLAGGVPMRGHYLRIWTTRVTGLAVQVEAFVEASAALPVARAQWAVESLSSQTTMNLVRAALSKSGEDASIRSLNWTDFWDKGRLVREVKVKSRTGIHRIEIGILEKSVILSRFEEFPQGDTLEGDFSLAAQVYPIYEEVEGSGEILSREVQELKYLKAYYPNTTTNPYAPLLSQKYLFSKFDPILGLTEEGRKAGFWAMSYIKEQAAKLLAQVPSAENSFRSGGVVLEGRYATVNYYNEVASLQGLKFTPPVSAHFQPRYEQVAGTSDWEMVPGASLRGRPIASREDALNRAARRLPDHNMVEYINDGFDDIQVYYAINKLFDSLRPMGFVDPELSTRPFHAYLYNPDIEYRDNAFYTDDTINFTTYSSKQQNMARDNTTIWHELGHGVMDRLMGDYIQLADTGGLSEGMADLVADLVVNDVTDGKTFPGRDKMRIINNTGFSLTNESHDDGEAYGGSMHDMVEAAMKKYGRPGLVKMADLILEAMRLARNHPALTANDWFGRMLFADELGGAPFRMPGELKELVLGALANRNFNLDGSETAKFTVMNGATEITSDGPGSRYNPVVLQLRPEESKAHTLTVSLKSTSTYKFQYLVTVKVGLRGGPLQGAVRWANEESQPIVATLNSESDTAKIDLSAAGECDEINRPDGSCQDFAYLQIYNNAAADYPVAKKRFYLRIFTLK